eukprot:gene30462-37680_t
MSAFNSASALPYKLAVAHEEMNSRRRNTMEDVHKIIPALPGILAVSRSFGDHGMKEFVTAEPYFSETNLLECGDCPILILACDGVWDVFSDQEAADLLLERYLVEGPYENAAEVLVTAAIEKGSADNVTAIVVFL